MRDRKPTEQRYITQAGLDLIKKFEGFSPVVYSCPAGHPTIGYGHLIKACERFDCINESEAEDLLREDVRVAEQAVQRLIDVPLSDGQFDALVSFTFNLGEGSLAKSTLRRKLNSGAYDEVPEQLMRWVYAGSKKLKGLVRRREAEVGLFLGGLE